MSLRSYMRFGVPSICALIFMTGCGGSSGSSGGSEDSDSTDSSSTINLMQLDNFEEADVVIGQMDFQGQDANQGGSVDANTLRAPSSNPSFADEILYLEDSGNNRVLGYNGIPADNNANADFVLGQPDFTSDTAGNEADEMDAPRSLTVTNGKLFTTDWGNSRVLIFDPAPESGPASASVVVGQNSFGESTTACSSSGLDSPEGHSTVDDKLIVADSENNRVLIWDGIPDSNGAPADIVLGQDDFSSCTGNDDDQDGVADGPTERTLSYPSGIWSDGERLVVIDSDNNRALIWESFPENNFASADVVLGQSDFNSRSSDPASASTFNVPIWGVDSNGQQLAIGDRGNHRILIWDTWPDQNGQAADVVLGQSDFTMNTENDDNQDGSVDDSPSARTLYLPAGVHITSGGSLLVADTFNNRYLVFDR